MGVSHQVVHDRTGLLVDSTLPREPLESRFAQHVLELLENNDRRRAMGHAAAATARRRSSPERCVERYYEAFNEARRHLDAATPESASGAGRSNLMQWTLLHSALLVLGYLRKRSIINRNSSAHPGWGESLEAATAPF